MTWSIRAAERREAPQLATFASILFRQAYEITHPEPTISDYLASSFAVPRFARTLEDPASTILLVVSANGSWIGYAELHQGPPTAPTTVLTRALPGTTPVEIVRFYVDQAWHGQGVAQALMRACEERARMRAGDALWLQAWGEAPKALRFYEKAGFEVYGTAVFAFGDRADGDLILARGLGTADAGRLPAE
ncbi:MAG: GNAT family N-acetyltransferase [Anaerolineae bacterium]|nr:GNAT family N-acetyltransferase [Gemmatimonadaceae bacterium]